MIGAESYLELFLPPSPFLSLSLSLSVCLSLSLQQQQKQRCAAKEHHHHQHLHQQQQHLQQIHPSLNWNCSANMVAARFVASLCLLAGFSLQVDVKSAKEAGKAGNFMEDEQWLSTISQYSRKIKHWNRFRDVSCAFSVLFQKRIWR